MYYVIQCRFSELLFQLCIKNAFFLGPCRNITTMCRKIAFFLGPCRNITIQGHQGQGVPGVPCRAIFSGREEILIFGEIFTSVWTIEFACHCCLSQLRCVKSAQMDAFAIFSSVPSPCHWQKDFKFGVFIISMRRRKVCWKMADCRTVTESLGMGEQHHHGVT